MGPSSTAGASSTSASGGGGVDFRFLEPFEEVPLAFSFTRPFADCTGVLVAGVRSRRAARCALVTILREGYRGKVGVDEVWQAGGGEDQSGTEFELRF